MHLEGELIFGVLFAMLTGIPTTLLSLASYVLTALALYTLAERRGLSKPWLAWIPVVNCWLLGSLSDQYRYVVKGQNKSKRKLLLVLSISMLFLAVGTAVVFVVGIGMVMNMTTAQSMHTVLMMPWMLIILGMALLICAAISYAVLRYMALYDVYKSMDPANSVMFLVLSILFHVTEPFFLFFNRQNDKGMPPRRQKQSASSPVEPQQPQEEYHSAREEENKDYL